MKKVGFFLYEHANRPMLLCLDALEQASRQQGNEAKVCERHGSADDEVGDEEMPPDRERPLEEAVAQQAGARQFDEVLHVPE